jgi:hypothetical protein
MKTPAEQLSATPILDLLRPLPKSDVEPINGRFAAPFLIVVGSIVMTGNLTTLVIPFGFLLINFLTIAFHEFGHLIAGWCVGLRFKGVRIDPFRIRIDSDKWKFIVRPRLFRGFAYMALDRARRVRSRLIVFVSGGPAVSLIVGIGAAVAGEIGLTRHYDSPWPTFLEFLGVWSFIIGSIGLIPFKSRGFANDGMILRALLFRREEALPMIASYALSAAMNDTPFAPLYVTRWFKLAARPSNLQSNRYAANWLAYVGAQEEQVAAQFLERCLADSALLEDDQRDKLIAEAAFFTAWRRQDAVKAEAWRKRIHSPARLHPLWQTRIKIALLCAGKQFEEANAELNYALTLIHAVPYSSQRQRAELEWIAWGEQIQQRMPVEVT